MSGLLMQYLPPELPSSWKRKPSDELEPDGRVSHAVTIRFVE